MEQIIEDCAMMKFEKLAEIKFMFKNCDPEKEKDRDEELEKVKSETELIKKQKT